MYEIISALLKSRNITFKRMCQDIGVRDSVFSDLKAGRTKSLSCEVVSKVANYLGVTCDYIITGIEKDSEFSNEELKVLLAYRKASYGEKENVRFILREHLTEASEKAG